MQKPPNRTMVRRAFGKTLRSLRLRTGLAQETLALECDINRGYLGGLERGLHVPTLDTVCKLLGPLKVTLPEFFEEFERIVRANRKSA